VTAVLPDRWLNEFSRGSRDLRLIRGEGAYVWDDGERQYLDLTSGGGTMLLGHNHPRVTEAIANQLAAFGGFPPGFIAAYHDVYPIDPAYPRRRALHQLYPLLVHLNHFGEEYGPIVDRVCREYVKNAT